MSDSIKNTIISSPSGFGRKGYGRKDGQLKSYLDMTMTRDD